MFNQNASTEAKKKINDVRKPLKTLCLKSMMMIQQRDALWATP